MKNKLWIISLLILAFAGDRVGAFILKKITDQSQFRYSRLYNGQAGCDILLAGSSRGLIFYQPYMEEKTGLSTTNLSYNGMPMELAAPLIKDHIDKNGTPELLLLDITLLDARMYARLVTEFNFYVPYSERLSGLLRDSFPNDYYAGKVTNLYRYNSEVFQRTLYYLNKSDEDWLLDRVISPSLQSDVVKQKTFNYDFNKKMLADLNNAVKYAQSKNVEVKLIVNPYYPAFAEKIGNLNELINAVEKTTELKVHNYANSIQEVEGFGDYQHLNKNGAKAFIDLLVEDGVLK